MKMTTMKGKIKKKIKKAVHPKKQRNILISLLFLIIILILSAVILKSAILTNESPQTNVRTRAAGYTCPTTSSQSYESIHAPGGEHKLGQSLDNHPEINLSLRGWGEVNKEKQPIDYGGDTDPIAPPSIASVFTGRLPNILKTYVVYEWDFQNNRSLAPAPATPQWPVHLIGLDAGAGEPILGLAAGRKVDGAGHTLMVLYATRDKITFTHSGGDNLTDGYLIYFVDLCVDPNLVAAYERDNASGRGSLPVVAPGHVFGYGSNNDVKFAIRDSMSLSFMDPRARKDWWQLGPPSGPTYPPVNRPTAPPPTATTYLPPTNIPPTQAQPIQPSSTPVVQFPSPTYPPYRPPTTSYPSPTSYNPPATSNPQPTSNYPQPTTYNLQPTTIPTITLTPTPTKTLTQIIVSHPVYQWVNDLKTNLLHYLKVILP